MTKSKATQLVEAAIAEANAAAPDTIKVRLKSTPDVITELEGGAAELLDLERQGFVLTRVTDDGEVIEATEGTEAPATEGSDA